MAVDSRMKAALWAPWGQWVLIVAAGAGPALIGAGTTPGLMTPAVIVALAFQIVVYGRILAQVQPGRATTFREILKEYSFSFVATGILIGLVALVLRVAAARLLVPHFPYILVIGVVDAAVGVLTIYVWPLVFLRHSTVAAILAGVSHLVHNIAPSLWIAGIVIVGQVIRTTGQLLYAEHRTGWGFAILLIAGAAFLYLAAATYAAALHTLLGVKVIDPQDESSPKIP